MHIQWSWCLLFQSSNGNTFLGTNLIQKIKTVSLSRNLLPTLTRICIIQWKRSLLLFSTRNILFGQNLSKKYLMKFNEYKFIKNLIAIVTFFRLKMPFSDKLVPKIRIVSLSWNLGSKSSSNMQNSILMFCFRSEIPFWGQIRLK